MNAGIPAAIVFYNIDCTITGIVITDNKFPIVITLADDAFNLGSDVFCPIVRRERTIALSIYTSGYSAMYASCSLIASSIALGPGAPFVRRFSTQVLRLIAS